MGLRRRARAAGDGHDGRRHGPRRDRHRRSLHGDQGVPRWLLGHRGTRPRRRHEDRRRRLQGVRRQGRGPTVRGRVTPTPDLRAEIDRIYREEYGRVVASLARHFGDLDIAEDAASEALIAAVEKWPTDGIPPNPDGWLTTTATRRAIDRLRRESLRDTKHQAALMISDDTPHEPTGLVEDDRLRLIFTCCHPALPPEARVALTLRLLGGLTVEEISRAFLVPETT